MTEDDILLVQSAKRGNMEAFSAIVANYKDFVYRTAYGICRNRSDAEDVTQDTFIKVYQAIKTLRDARTFPSWIARIAVRRALDYRERQQNRRADPLEDTRLADGVIPHEQAEVRMDIEQAMATLAVDHRTVLVLRELHGFNYEELAQILDIPVGTVRSRLHHARLQLRALLKEGGAK